MKRKQATRPRWRARVASAFLALGFLAALGATAWVFHSPVWAALRSHPYFAVKDLVVRGAGPLLTREEIFDWLGLHSGVSLWDISPVRVRSRLEMHPLIDRVAVRRDFPSYFEINVRERRPEAIVVLDALYYVDRSGHVLRALSSEHNRDYPLITGLNADTPAGYRTWALRRALRVLRMCERITCFGGVSEIHLDAHGGLVLHPRRPRLSLLLGSGSWRGKIERAKRVVDTWGVQTDRLTTIDLRYRNQVLVRFQPPARPLPVARRAAGVRI